jgi:Creatinine amidohydrolase
MKPATVFLGDDYGRGRSFLKQHHTVIVPVGATEQHGPHLALLTDVLIPQEVARRAEAQCAGRSAGHYTLSYPHVSFKGLAYLRIPTFMSMIEDLAAVYWATKSGTWATRDRPIRRPARSTSRPAWRRRSRSSRTSKRRSLRFRVGHRGTVPHSRQVGDCPHLVDRSGTPNGLGGSGNYCVFGSLSWPGIGSFGVMFRGPSA